MIRVTFLPDQVCVEAEVGESWLSVAERAGIEIPAAVVWGRVAPALWNSRTAKKFALVSLRSRAMARMAPRLLPMSFEIPRGDHRNQTLSAK